MPRFDHWTAKNFDAFVFDGIGDDKDPAPAAPPLLTTDAQPDAPGPAAPTIVADGASITSTIDAIGDQDFFKVTLTAGQTYEIGEYQVVGGPSGVPLNDAYVELYDSTGHLITSADGGGPNTQEGLDALLTYQATYTGTYYINARAFDQDGTNGATGDGVGDYRLFVKTTPPDPTAYHPFYSPDSPLSSIDWGTQVPHTVRNPDGDSGPRDNGVPDTGTYTDSTYNIPGKNVITYYFAKAGDVFIDDDPTTTGTTETIVAKGMADWEKAAFRLALDQYEHVADIVYIEVANRSQADFKFITYNGTPGAGASLLGRMSPPGEDNAGQGEFNSGDVRWTQEGLAQGGFYFPTLLHEIGHGHGMAHPHDNGGHSTVMPGADGGTGGIGGGLGDDLLSQQVFTVMSYNDGWQSSPYGMPSSGDATGLNSDPYGWQGTLAALDIAVIQDKYGINEDYATGDDSYVIKDVNAPGTFFQTLWDAGGTDEMRYNGARAANIDLRPATLRYEIGGGGWVSYAYGIYGGYTIANGVTIENAIGGVGADTIRGNDAANNLNGRAGADTMFGYAGNDTFIVDNAADWAIEAANAGSDTVFTSVSYRLAAGQSIELLATSLRTGTEALQLVGNALAQRIDGNNGNNAIYSEGGGDTLHGFRGNDTFYVTTAIDKVFENAGEGSDTVLAARSFGLLGGQSIELLATSSRLGTGAINLSGNDLAQRIDGNNGANSLYGNDGNDTIYGFEGADRIVGGAGRDVIDGGAGIDTLGYGAVAHSTGLGRDLIQYFDFAQDKFDLTFMPTLIDAKVTHGGLNTAAFDANLAAAVGAAQLGPHHAVLFDPDGGDLNQSGHLYLIVDANGVAGYQAGQDYVMELQNSSGTLTLGDFV